jgi:hypothetical protein
LDFILVEMRVLWSWMYMSVFTTCIFKGHCDFSGEWLEEQ